VKYRFLFFLYRNNFSQYAIDFFLAPNRFQIDCVQTVELISYTYDIITWKTAQNTLVLRSYDTVADSFHRAFYFKF